MWRPDPMLAQYIDYGMPLIPLAYRSKEPAAKGWTENTYPSIAFRQRNIGVRAGEWVNIDGKQGYLCILDYDASDITALRLLCTNLHMPRTTCVRSGGQHHGYHLYYLTDFETRKHGMLAYEHASIDLLGKGSFAVIPPSIVERPYRYLIGLEELSFLSRQTYDLLLDTLRRGKKEIREQRAKQRP
jgi:hypothetical protein